MTAIPQRGTGSPQPFSASELFRTIDGNLHTIRSDRQSPEYGWIGEDQGEFFFHPTTQAGVTWPRQTRELDSVGQKQLLAIIPSTMGNWWADEMIWFMPALRHEIIVREPKMRSTEQYFDIEAIRRIALERAADHKANYKEDSAREEHFRYDHLHRLLHAKTLKEQVAVIDLIIQQLECRYPQPATEDPGRDAMAERALDLHYLAVLYHVRKRASEARACYERALAEYKVAAEQKPNLRPLYALCQMDYGVLCQTILNQFADARSHFAAAREIAEGRPPAPFVAFTLYKEAEAARRMGAFGVSDRCMKSACDQMIDIDAERAHPMTGAVLKYNAWACMEQCRFEQARQSFEASRQVFQKLLTRNPNSANYQIELFHIQHGLAMIERFQGRDEEAIRMFRGLTEDIAATVQSLDNSGDLLANFAETRQLYAERYVNSVDRQGDCRLYGAIPDYTEAADDYRRALRAVPNIPEGRREAITLDLLYRRAIALAMPASANNPNQNLTLAKLLCDQAASLEEQLVKKYSVYPLLRKTAINKAIAHTLIHNPATAAENELWNLIHPTFDSASPILGENSRDSVRLPLATKELDRDEIERLMFGCTLLLRNWKQWGLTELDALTCCDHLRAACRSATRPARLAGRAIDTGLLKYLRPFYDEMFQFKAELSPPPVKELVEIAWEATRGASYRKPKEIAPILVFYRTVPRGRAPSGYLLLDVTATPGQPGGITQCHLLDEEWCDENTLNRASTSGSSLPLPRGLARVLAGLQYEAPLECRWRDPVTGLGIPQVPTNGEWTNNYALGGLVPVPVAFPQATSLLDRHYFPFNLGAVLPSERFSDRADGLALGIAARSAPAPSEQIPHMRPALPTIPAPGRP
ncbi:MAG: hypothetical protein LC104_14740 [Bacteroidales bacterium]|nr:hypothetical protein [Bacteroidales bacterium]